MERINIIRNSMDVFYYLHGDIHIVVVDGIANLIRSANDDTLGLSVIKALKVLDGRLLFSCKEIEDFAKARNNR